MTAVPEVTQAPEAATPGRLRVAVELPADVFRRLRVWAALRGQPVAHTASDVVCRAVPTDKQLAELVQQSGARHDHQD
jgi:hypothetical protein